jgi:hypothetical protein
MAEPSIVRIRSLDTSPERWTSGSAEFSLVPSKKALWEALTLVRNDGVQPATDFCHETSTDD